MCPVCLATTGLYLASGISVGGASSFLGRPLDAPATQRTRP